MTGESPTKSLSVVVAAREAGTSLRKCLASLAAQVSPAQTEILVADGSGGDAAHQLTEEFPSVRLLRLPPGMNVPRLWSAGIAASRGRIVALTIEQCVPEPNWVAQILRAHAAEWPAIGGAIDADPNVGPVDWAVYFSRYSRCIPPFAPQFLDDLPGDNCSYKRAALDSLRKHMKEGFWETFIHWAMRARGDQLLSDPSIVVRYCGSFSWPSFLRRRFVDGRYFASRQAQEMSLLSRIVRAIAFVAVPLVMLGRIATRIWRHRRHRWKFLIALPLVLAFLLAWAIGECLGYLFGPPKEMVAGAEKSAVWNHIG